MLVGTAVEDDSVVQGYLNVVVGSSVVSGSIVTEV